MREFAYRIVCGTLEEDGHSDELLHAVYAGHPELTPQQKRFLKNLSYGTIERCIELDALLNQYSSVRVHRMEQPVRTVLRMALYELRYMDQVPAPATCNEAVELVKKKDCGRYAAFVNGVLRTLTRQRDSLEIKKDWVRLSLPRELMDHLTSRIWEKDSASDRPGFFRTPGRCHPAHPHRPDHYSGVWQDAGGSGNCL